MKMIEEWFKYSYDLDFFVKWTPGITYEIYDRWTWKQLDLSNFSDKEMSKVVADAYFYWITTDKETFYKMIEDAKESYNKKQWI